MIKRILFLLYNNHVTLIFNGPLLKTLTMTPAIQIDPINGFKKFNTRAAKATEKISGKGYSVVNNSELTSLPEAPAGAVLMLKSKRNIENLRKKGEVLLTT